MRRGHQSARGARLDGPAYGRRPFRRRRVRPRQREKDRGRSREIAPGLFTLRNRATTARSAAFAEAAHVALHAALGVFELRAAVRTRSDERLRAVVEAHLYL